jgi:hypothetical protein
MRLEELKVETPTMARRRRRFVRVPVWWFGPTPIWWTVDVLGSGYSI